MKKMLLFICLFTLAACGEDGAPGPAGPPGPQGNANVTGTEHIVIDSLSWVYSINSNWYSIDSKVPEISADIKDFGLVMVYQQLGSGANTSWIPLPDTYDNVTTNYEFYTGGITLYSFNVDNTTPSLPWNMVVRIVVIPASLRKANPNTDWQNYKEVEKLLLAGKPL